MHIELRKEQNFFSRTLSITRLDCVGVSESKNHIFLTKPPPNNDRSSGNYFLHDIFNIKSFRLKSCLASLFLSDEIVFENGKKRFQHVKRKRWSWIGKYEVRGNFPLSLNRMGQVTMVDSSGKNVDYSIIPSSISYMREGVPCQTFWSPSGKFLFLFPSLEIGRLVMPPCCSFLGFRSRRRHCRRCRRRHR